MLNELKDIAGQHELVAENIEERITLRLNQLIKSLKEERRKVNKFKSYFIK
jgi:formin-binding protein 1